MTDTTNQPRLASRGEPGTNNRVELIGTLRIQGRGKRAGVVRERRTLTRADAALLTVQVNEPYAEPYLVRLTLSPSPEQEQLLHELQEDDRVKVEGLLVVRERYDTRHRSESRAAGRPTKALEIMVQRISRAANNELQDGSAVRLAQAMITTPPQITTRRGDGMLVARTHVLVRSLLPPAQPWLRAVRTLEHRLPIDMPVALPHVEFALREGNVVNLEGFLEAWVERLSPQRDQAVQASLAAARQRWTRELEQASPGELARKQRLMLADLDGLSRAVQLRVVAGLIEPLAGPATSVEQAQANRAAFEELMRGRAAERQTRRDRQRQQAAEAALALAASDQHQDGTPAAPDPATAVPPALEGWIG